MQKLLFFWINSSKSLYSRCIIGINIPSLSYFVDFVAVIFSAKLYKYHSTI